MIFNRHVNNIIIISFIKIYNFLICNELNIIFLTPKIQDKTNENLDLKIKF